MFDSTGSYYLHIFSPVISLGINVLCQILISRNIERFSLLRSVVIAFVFGVLSLFFLELYYLSQMPLTVEEKAFSILVNIITYFAFAYGYFHFINLGETARRIRILRELYNSGRGLSMAELLRCYNAREIIEKRINRLVNNGQIIYKDGRYYLASSLMLLIAKIIVAMKVIILGKRSEFALLEDEKV